METSIEIFANEVVKDEYFVHNIITEDEFCGSLGCRDCAFSIAQGSFNKCNIPNALYKLKQDEIAIELKNTNVFKNLKKLTQNCLFKELR